MSFVCLSFGLILCLFDHLCLTFACFWTLFVDYPSLNTLRLDLHDAWLCFLQEAKQRELLDGRKLENRTLTVVSGPDMVNITCLNFTAFSEEVAKVASALTLWKQTRCYTVMCLVLPNRSLGLMGPGSLDFQALKHTTMFLNDTGPNKSCR